MHRTGKPVRRCHGCGLNFRDHCGMYDSPQEMWHGHHKCPGYNNEELLAEYEARLAKEGSDKGKATRKSVARLRQTEPHHNGDRHSTIETGA